MSVFEYAAALIAIVLGLSVARVLSGIGAFLVSANRTASDWLVLGWCIALIIVQGGWWMLGWFTLGQLETMSYGSVLSSFTATAMLFLASYTLIPGAGASLASPSSAMGVLRPTFFACLGLHFSINIIQALVDGSFIPTQGLVVLMMVLSWTGAFLRSIKAHTALLVVWIACMLTLSSIAVPAMGVNSGSVLEAN